MGTFDSVYLNKIRHLEEENQQLKKLIENFPVPLIRNSPLKRKGLQSPNSPPELLRAPDHGDDFHDAIQNPFSGKLMPPGPWRYSTVDRDNDGRDDAITFDDEVADRAERMGAYVRKTP